MTKDSDSKKEEAKKGENPSLGLKRYFQARDTSKDDVSLILKCHLINEYFLDQIIHISFKRGDLLTDDRSGIGYYQKVLIIEALNLLKPEVITSLKALNALRNRCSHELDYSVTEKDCDRLGQPFGKEYTMLKKDRREHDDLISLTVIFPLREVERLYESLVTEAK